VAIFPQLVRHNPRILPAQRLRSTRVVDYALARLRPELNLVKGEKWTEADLDGLPVEEPDAFDRKAGRLLEDGQDKFLDSVAMAISAFANSGGGSLILGVRDDGTPDGLPPIRGQSQTAIRDWIEQMIPHLLDYPLSCGQKPIRLKPFGRRLKQCLLQSPSIFSLLLKTLQAS
jgi:Putative DNA-binding domain